MSDASIRMLYESRLQTWAETQGYPVAYQNTKFDPATQAVDGLWLAAFLIPANTTSQTLDGSDEIFAGVFQISVNVKQGIGSAVVERIVGGLKALFTNNLRLTNASNFSVQIVTPISAAPSIQGASQYVVPTSFRYQAIDF